MQTQEQNSTLCSYVQTNSQKKDNRVSPEQTVLLYKAPLVVKTTTSNGSYLKLQYIFSLLIHLKIVFCIDELIVQSIKCQIICKIHITEL